MALLRIQFLNNLNSWDEDTIIPKNIARKWFNESETEFPSLYEANSPLEELEAVAAFSLTNLSKGIEVGYIVRILFEDLTRVGIPPNNDRPGTTGIVSVDFRHWEIPGEKEPIHQLLQHIAVQSRHGEDRFRWIGKQMQRDTLQRFLQLPPNQVIEEANRRCKRKLGESSEKQRPLGRQINEELRRSPIVLPEARIRSHAHRLYVQRISTNLPGDAQHDWISSEQELRDHYARELTGYSQP